MCLGAWGAVACWGACTASSLPRRVTHALCVASRTIFMRSSVCGLLAAACCHGTCTPHRCTRGVVMVGDPQQLPATIFSQAGKQLALERSLFERLDAVSEG